MDLIVNTFSTLWNELSGLTLPILNISITDFLISILIIILTIKFFHYLLGHHTSDSKSDD